MKWLLQFTVREDEVKQNRRLPEIAFFDTDGNPINLSSGSPIATWAPDTDYSLGQIVVNSGRLYQAVDDHTSGAVFGGDSAHWTMLDSETDALALAQLATHAGLTTTAHGGIVSSGDSRLTDARTPTAHKTSHAVGGSDVLSPADIGAVAASLVDAKGDLIAGTADNTVARKAVGSDGQVLIADAASGGGIKWADGATPTAHKTSHGSGGSDPITPTDIAAVPQSLVDAKGDLIVGTADNTVARKAVGSDGQVLTADAASGGGIKWADGHADIQSFAAGSGQTWTKPAGATAVRVIAVGAGGGGGGGASSVSTAKTGGGGGGGGAVAIIDLLASQLGATETVNVGAGGNGGAGGAAGAGANGTVGGSGGDSDFATGLVKAGGGSGGAGGTSSNSNGGNGGSVGAVSGLRTTNADGLSGQGVITTSGSVGRNTEYGGASGGGGSTSGPQDGGSSVWGGSGGGNGGRVTATNTAGSPGAGGSSKSYTAGTGGAAGTLGPPATAGGNGAAGPTPYCGQGGGGGGGGAAAAGAAGGSGGRGCGGGGGGASSSATSSAAGATGGNGGDGRVIVISW